MREYRQWILSRRMPSGIFCILNARRNLGDRYTYHSRLITFSLRENVPSVRNSWNFFLHGFRRASSNSSRLFRFFYHFGIVPPPWTGLFVILQYSNTEKGCPCSFFAFRETAVRTIRHIMKTPSRNLYDFASSFVERVTWYTYILFFWSCMPAT